MMQFVFGFVFGVAAVVATGLGCIFVARDNKTKDLRFVIRKESSPRP